MFLSSAGHKTPKELGMKDQDLIMVYDTSKVQQSNDNKNCSQLAPTPKQTKAKKKKKKKKKKGSVNNKGKGNSKNNKPQHEEEPFKIKTLGNTRLSILNNSARFMTRHDLSSNKFGTA